MREILFKAKRKDTGEWTEGLLAFMRKINLSDEEELETENVLVIQNFIVDSVEIDESTICQYTGLTDKNGNKIWENDIVKHYNNPNEPARFVTGTIFWNEDNLRYERTSQYEHERYSILYDCVYEVIGNIFDNPELIGE